MALPRENRLPLRFERDRISREGKTFYGQNLTLVMAPSGTSTSSNPNSEEFTQTTKIPRFGILLSKKIAKLAVHRNLIRRRISSLLSGMVSSFPQNDYLVIPKRSILTITSTDLLSDLEFILSKIKK